MTDDQIFEQQLMDSLQETQDKLTVIEKNITSVMQEFTSNPQKASGYWRDKQKEIDGLFSDLIVTFDDWAQSGIPLQYARYLREINQRVRAMRAVEATASVPLQQLIGSNASKNIVAALYLDALSTFNAAVTAGKANVERLLRMTQQTVLSESLVNTTVAEGFVGGNLDNAISALGGQLYSNLKAAGEDGLFVIAGSKRFTPSYYAEMVARTKFHEAHTMATLAQCQNYGTDLVQISDHNTKTPMCLVHEGKVYSISGKDPNFPPLDGTPPYHPNCLHLMYPTFKQAMVVQGTLDDYISYSNGDTDVSPLQKAAS